MNETELRQLTQKAIDDAIASGTPTIEKKWLAHQIVCAQGDISGDGADFAIACCYHTIQRMAGDLIRQVGKQETDEESTQYRLPGFEYVRSHYSIVRAKTAQVVKLAEMTRDEVLAKADELEAHGKGALAHADELRRYAEGIAATGTDA
jgi:hypothetical protein